MSWLYAIILGVIVGWLYSYAVNADRRKYITNIIAGAIGSVVGIWFFANLLGLGFPLVGGLTTFTLLGVIWGIVGSLIVSAIAQGAMPERERRITGERGPAYHEEIKTERREKKDDDDRANRQ
jgi:uncharacterized membrane protein YeaQ/YmgE (transglycosylase-associated protein family)